MPFPSAARMRPDQAGAGRAPLAGHHVEQHRLLLGHRAEGRGSVPRGVEALCAQSDEGLVVGVVEPEQLADHVHGDPGRDVLGQVRRRARGRQLVEPTRHDRFDLGSSFSSRARVNSGATSLRNRVCTGGSVKPSPPTSAVEPGPASRNRCRMSLL